MNFKNAFALVLVLEALVIVLAIINYGWTLEGLQATTRFSGRLSLVIFSVIFLFYNYPRLNVRRLLSDKFFLVFAIAHSIHLCGLLSFIYFSKNSLNPLRAAGGMLAYAMIFIMPLIQQKFHEKKLTGKLFNRATLIYFFYVWFIFVMTYVPRVRGTAQNVGGTYMESVVLLGWVALMMLFKLYQLFVTQRARG